MVGSDGTPVILLSTTKDPTTRRLDVLIQIEGSTFAEVLYNTGTGFSTTEGQP
jgi:hypothetical protein